MSDDGFDPRPDDDGPLWLAAFAALALLLGAAAALVFFITLLFGGLT